MFFIIIWPILEAEIMTISSAQACKIWIVILEILLNILKFIYSEKATKFCEIFTLLLSYVVPVKSKVKISQNFVAFSEYMNFTAAFIYLFIKPIYL